MQGSPTEIRTADAHEDECTEPFGFSYSLRELDGGIYLCLPEMALSPSSEMLLQHRIALVLFLGKAPLYKAYPLIELLKQVAVGAALKDGTGFGSFESDWFARVGRIDHV